MTIYDHVMTSYDNSWRTFIIVNIDYLSGTGNALFYWPQKIPLVSVSLISTLQSIVQRHHKWKEASQVEWYIEKPVRLLHLVHHKDIQDKECAISLNATFLVEHKGRSPLLSTITSHLPV